MNFLSRKDIETVTKDDGVGVLALWLFIGLPIGYGLSDNNPVLTPLIATAFVVFVDALQWGVKLACRGLRKRRRKWYA